MDAFYNAFPVVHDICIPVSTCTTLRCSVATGDTAEELLGHQAVGKPGWGHDRRKSCSQGNFDSEILLGRAVNSLLAELGF